MPADRDHRPLWAAGWRWLPKPERAGIARFVPRSFAYWCPDCREHVGKF